VKRAVAAQEQIRERLHQKNAGANQDDQLDAGSDESAPIEVVTARAERRRHNGSVRRGTRRRQSEVSTYVVFVNVWGVKNCGEKIPERMGLPIRRQVNLPRQTGLPLQRQAGRRAGRLRAGWVMGLPGDLGVLRLVTFLRGPWQARRNWSQKRFGGYAGRCGEAGWLCRRVRWRVEWRSGRREEPKKMGEGMVDALGGLEVFGAAGEQIGEVVGVGGWRFGVSGAELGLRVLRTGGRSGRGTGSVRRRGRLGRKLRRTGQMFSWAVLFRF
jgi:hypothetical protein